MRSALVAVPAVLAACATGATDPVLVTAPDVVRTAATSTVVAGQAVVLDAALWRDFQPSSPADGKPLVASVRVRAADASALAPGVSADSVWVLSGAQAWAARAVQEQPRGATGAYLEVVARDGPKWGPGVRVDVVLRLRDGAGHAAYVRVADQVIARTD